MNTHDEKPLNPHHEDDSDMNGSDKASLDEWLSWIEKQHVTAIDLGLERINDVYQLLIQNISASNKNKSSVAHSSNTESQNQESAQLDTSRAAKEVDVLKQGSINSHPVKLAKKIITVAGTNGKGTTIAALESLFLNAEQRVATYTSPHILKFNERIKLDGKPVSDDQLYKAFEHVRRAQLMSPHSLSFFEFTSLAAFYIFSQQSLDVLLLEVGLGGRLDAVNIIDPDVAIITSIALDHQEWLGDNLKAIAFEKAGILRENIDFVCGQSHVNEYLKTLADEKKCQTYSYAEDFELTTNDDGRLSFKQSNHKEQSAKNSSSAYIWRGSEKVALDAEVQGSSDRKHNTQLVTKTVDISHHLVNLQLPHNSIACALQAFHLVKASLAIDLSSEQINLALQKAQLAGRYQKLNSECGVPIVLDVAHNPAAVTLLKQRLIEEYSGYSFSAVFSVLSDKDVTSMVEIMRDIVDRWYIAQIQHPRGQQLSVLKQCIFETLATQQELQKSTVSVDAGALDNTANQKVSRELTVNFFDNLAAATNQAFTDAINTRNLSSPAKSNKPHLVIAFGSFHVVEELLSSDIF